jgi:signal transduction histidine kinase
VSDNGSGMSTEEIAAALNPELSQANASTELQMKASGGLGLGYGIVRDLALANGATVSIESDPAVGTTVTIAFVAGS